MARVTTDMQDNVTQEKLERVKLAAYQSGVAFGEAAQSEAAEKLAEALEGVAPILEGIINDGAADIQEGCLTSFTDEMKDCSTALQTLAQYRETKP